MADLLLELGRPHGGGMVGVIDTRLVTCGTSHRLDTISVFPPFLDLLHFVKAVALQRLPARFSWSEDNPTWVDFIALPVGEDSPLCNLKILYVNYEDDDIPWFNAVVERDMVVRAFLPPLLRLSQQYLLMEKVWGLPRQTVKAVETLILNGVPPRSDIHSPQSVEFYLSHDDRDVYIWMHEEEIVRLEAHDNDSFWQDLIRFVTQIKRADFPAQYEHIRRIEFSREDKYYEDRTWLHALPVESEANFRLKIYTQYTAMEEVPFLRLEEVVNRKQCLDSFKKVCKTFLDATHQGKPDRGGNTGDLRTLLLEALEELQDDLSEEAAEE